jgi:hypothetical protein
MTSIASRALRARTWWRLPSASLLAALLLHGCGGGVGSGGTGTYASGPITGFGSIVVGGVRFDDSAAAVLDDDDGGRTRDALKLGVTVDVEAGAVRTDATGASATATRVRIGSALSGPVQSIAAGAGTFVALGQTVRVAVETVFDERIAGGFAGLGVGDGVEVYGLYDAATGSLHATRVEPRQSGAPWRLRAPVGTLDTAARTFTIGNATFTYAGAARVPADLVAGQFVRLRLARALDAGGRYVVQSFGTALRVPDDRDEVHLKGLVTALQSTSRFDVDGIAVDATSAQFPKGTAGLVVGARVKAEGSAAAGVLVATKVEVESDDDVRDKGFELKGRITAVDTGARTFVLRGVTISYARPDLEFEGGTLADLVVDARVEVKGRLSADRTQLEATKIEFDD